MFKSIVKLLLLLVVALGIYLFIRRIRKLSKYNEFYTVLKRCKISIVTFGALPIEVSRRIMKKIKKMPLANGYRLEIGGNAEEKSKAVQSLLTYIPVLITLMLATLILTFHSLRLAFIIGCVALLSIGFGMLSLWCFSSPLGFNPLIGTAGLIGIALNDTIVVLAALHANKHSKGNIQQITTEIVACTRHILSTTLTTIAGFLPLLILTGGTFWPPLAIVIIGGVAGATTLSLVFTPCFYYLIYR